MYKLRSESGDDLAFEADHSLDVSERESVASLPKLKDRASSISRGGSFTVIE